MCAFGRHSVKATASGNELLGRIAKGDREAFQVFYDCYGARVMTVIRRQVGVRQLAEELVQDVFVAAWLGARRYREEMGSADQWLFGITRHKLQDHWRRVRGLVGAIGVPGVEAGLAAGMVSVDVKLAIQEALASLPAEQRRTLDLIYQNGLTFAETARALRVPPGTVKSRVHAALLTLRTVFERSAS